MTTTPVQKFSVDQLHEAIGTIKISVTHKGRTFILEDGTKVKMKDLVKRVNELSKDEKIGNLKAQLITLDLRGRVKLESTSFLTRFLARLYQIFGNRSLFQDVHINTLDAIKKVELTKEQKQFIKEFSQAFDKIKNNPKKKVLPETMFEAFPYLLAMDMIKISVKELKNDDPNLIKEREDQLKKITAKLEQFEKKMKEGNTEPKEEVPELKMLFETFQNFEPQVKIEIMNNIKDPILLPMMLVFGKDETIMNEVAEVKALRPAVMKAIKLAKYY